MRFPRNLLIVVVCISALGLLAWAQMPKAGLYEVTSTMTWQQSPFPGNMQPMGGSRTTQICVTQEQIDKYGSVPPQTQGDCQVTNIVKKPSGMTAEMVCTGHVAGKGDIQTSWTSDSRTTSKVHFTGTMEVGPNPQPFEWTVNSTSVYKGANCGSVKPMITR